MEPLRWILLLIGAVLIGAIYWFGRRHEREQRSEGLFERARRAARRDEGGEEAPPGRAEPDLDISDLDAHGFDVETRPGATAWAAPGADRDAGAGDPRSDESVSDDLESAEPVPRAPDESAREPDPGNDASYAPGDEAGGPEEADAAGEPPPVVTRPDRKAGTDAPSEPASSALPDTPAGNPAHDKRSGGAGEEVPPKTTREPTAERAGPAEDEVASGHGHGAAPDAGERVVVLHVVALSGERLVGSRLRDALERNGLRHGTYDIFHASDSEGSTVFSVANAVEPGTFDRTTMDTLTTPGIALFMQVPGPQSAETVFDRMLSTARAVADELDARVLDDRHSTLTRQTEQHLREELRLFDRTARMSHHGSR